MVGDLTRQDSPTSRDEFPNGRFGDARSPAYGDLYEWGVGLKLSVCTFSQRRLKCGDELEASLWTILASRSFTTMGSSYNLIRYIDLILFLSLRHSLFNSLVRRTTSS